MNITLKKTHLHGRINQLHATKKKKDNRELYFFLLQENLKSETLKVEIQKSGFKPRKFVVSLEY